MEIDSSIVLQSVLGIGRSRVNGSWTKNSTAIPLQPRLLELTAASATTGSFDRGGHS